MKNVLIVFSGKAQSGKTTASNALKKIIYADIENRNPDINPNRLGGGAHIHSFAKALKEIASEYFGWTGDKGLYYHDTADSGAVDIHGDGQVDAIGSLPIPDKGRQLLINIGQVFRGIRPTIWVDYVINNIKKHSEEHNSGQVYIIDDMRFRNELAIAKTFENCVSVRLRRNSQLGIDDISENDLDNSEFDYHIDNNGDPEDLEAKMSGLFEEIKLKYR